MPGWHDVACTALMLTAVACLLPVALVLQGMEVHVWWIRRRGLDKRRR